MKMNLITFIKNKINELFSSQMGTKYSAVLLPTPKLNEQELQKDVLTPGVLVGYRLMAAEGLLATYENKFLVLQNEAAKQSSLSFNTKSGHLYSQLSLVNKNIDLLKKEIATLMALNEKYLNNYKAFLSLYEITEVVPTKQATTNTKKK
jgi:hypothetical protein